MNFGFVIDNRTCIGCHACSVACKQENEVPLGVHRTWVKVVDRGLFPNTSRHFQVTRCNHCANPPCVRICPVTAMYKREDGIVDFDPESCIGCKACLQACPYDAIHIDPNSGTAAKCHYCAHKVESGLEPACVAVCPEHSIISGDMDDPNSEISRILSAHPVSVRRPEQGTAPKLFYIDGDAVSLTPTAAPLGSMAWSDVDRSGTQNPPAAQSGHQGLGAGYGPVFLAGDRVAEHMVQTAYTVRHKVPWHWPVPAYLVTKAIAAGVPIVLVILRLLDIGTGAFSERVGADGLPTNSLFPYTLSWCAMLVALGFTGITTALLVLDLERPERFLRILTRPQWGSWLTRGAFILIAHTVVLVLYCAAVIGAPVWQGPLLVIAAVTGTLTAAYTGFLFAQAEGRDLWQSGLSPVHLVLQAVMAGGGLIALMSPLVGLVLATSEGGFVIATVWSDPSVVVWIARASLVVFALALIADAVTVVFELVTPHASSSAALAAADIWSGRFARQVRVGTLLAGRAVPLVLAFLAVEVANTVLSMGDYSFKDETWLIGPIRSITLLSGLAFGLAMIGLYLYEHAYVTAPQEIPNS